MNYPIAVTLAVLIGLSSTSLAQSCLDTVKKNGLTIGTNPGYPPFELLDTNNQVVGFDIDLANAVAKKLGLKVNWVSQPFDGLIPALISKKIDVIAAGMTVTEERKKAVRFTVPYDSSESVIVARKEHPEYNTAASLIGKSVGVELGTVQEKFAQGIKGASVKSLNQFTDAAIGVQTRQIDTMLLDRIVAEQFVKTYPDLRITGALNKSDKAMALRQDCGDLQNRMNVALLLMKKNGEMSALRQKWFK